MSWQVHREVTVLFGGARALLMQAAHPLVVAGANQTGMYERNPWKRLQRTLILTYTMTFGTKAEAHAAADKINDVHTRINGVDPVTGKSYDALDPDLLLYVHACLVDSAPAVRGAHRRARSTTQVVSGSTKSRCSPRNSAWFRARRSRRRCRRCVPGSPTSKIAVTSR